MTNTTTKQRAFSGAAGTPVTPWTIAAYAMTHAVPATRGMSNLENITGAFGTDVMGSPPRTPVPV